MRLSEKKLKLILKNGTAKIRNNTTVSTTNVEPDISCQPLEKKKNSRFNTQVDIHVRSFRYRLAYFPDFNHYFIFWLIFTLDHFDTDLQILTVSVRKRRLMELLRSEYLQMIRPEKLEKFPTLKKK
jgi:hypothetical protein